MSEVHTSSPHTRLSRETRHLLMAATIALVLLWVLARVRFPDRAVTPNPIPPLITQLSGRPPGYADLASEVARAQSRLSGSLLAIPRSTMPRDTGVALRLRGDTAIALLSDAQRAASDPSKIVASHRASGLTIVRVTAGSPVLAPAPWAPDRLDVPRYFLAATAAPDAVGVSLRPVYVGSLQPTPTPAWSGPIWRVPASTDATPGTWLFTGEGELAGLIATDADALAIVPGEVLLADAERLSSQREAPAPGELGIVAQALTAPLAAATGATAGVIVAHVDAQGPAASKLSIGDVVQSVGDTAVATVRDWQAATGRLVADERVSLTIWRRGQSSRVELVAAGPSAAARESLGLTLRWVAGSGSEVVRVDPGSAASIAGVRTGDVVTAIGSTMMPTPVQIRRSFAAAEASKPLIVGITRGDTHHVTAVVK